MGHHLDPSTSSGQRPSTSSGHRLLIVRPAEPAGASASHRPSGPQPRTCWSTWAPTRRWPGVNCAISVAAGPGSPTCPIAPSRTRTARLLRGVTDALQATGVRLHPALPSIPTKENYHDHHSLVPSPLGARLCRSRAIGTGLIFATIMFGPAVPDWVADGILGLCLGVPLGLVQARQVRRLGPSGAAWAVAVATATTLGAMVVQGPLEETGWGFVPEGAAHAAVLGLLLGAAQLAVLRIAPRRPGGSPTRRSECAAGTGCGCGRPCVRRSRDGRPVAPEGLERSRSGPPSPNSTGCTTACCGRWCWVWRRKPAWRPANRGGPAGADRSSPRGQRDRRGGVRRSAGRLGRTARLAGRRKQGLHLVQTLLLALLRLVASLLDGVAGLGHRDAGPATGKRLQVDDVRHL